MGNRIYYFTGSGNSLAIARSLAEGLGETEVLPIAKSMGGFEGAEEERIGIISPVFAWGPPRMVAEFLRRFRAKRNQYVFAISDCGGTPGATLKRIEALLRSGGTRLGAGFAVRGDVHVLLPGGDEMGIIRFAQRVAKEPPRHFAERKEELLQAILSKAEHKPETSNWAGNMLGRLTYGAAMFSFRRRDKGFSVSDACVSCGVCTRVCPRKNVRLVNGRPTWHQDCEMCNACILWCPQTAITFRGHVPTEPRHHPDVALPDVLLWPELQTD